MTASMTTIEQVARAIQRHVPDDQIEAFMQELLVIEGNQSFKTSIVVLARILQVIRKQPVLPDDESVFHWDHRAKE